MLTEQPDGSYQLTAKHSGKVLEVYGGSTADGARLAQWWWHGRPNQRWYLIQVGSGAYQLMGVQSGKTLQVQDASTNNGATVVQGPYDTGSWDSSQDHRR